jgi:hypothetical protein
MIQIHTNRGRTATFPPDVQEDVPVLPVQVAKSTTITGFYTALVRHAI